MKSCKPWTSSEIDQLRSSYSAWPPNLKSLSISIGRSRASIKMKAGQLGLAKGNELTDEEKDFISKNASILGISKTSRKINRSPTTVRKFIKDNALQISLSAHNKWIPNESELEMIKNSSWNMIYELSSKIGRSIPLIRRQMRLMGILKPAVERVERDREYRPVRVKPRIESKIQAPRSLDGENRIREAMARLGLNK